jgi:hypothetical protein
MVPSISVVPTMHEQVDQGAGQEDEVRQHSQHMGAMFRPKKKCCDYQ